MKTIDMTFQAMGASTVSVPYADLYMGLKTGVADGQENPWVNVVGMKFSIQSLSERFRHMPMLPLISRFILKL